MKNTLMAGLAALGSLFFTAAIGNKFIGKQDELYKADTKKSVIEWVGKKVTGSHQGTITLSNGNFIVKNNKLVGGNFDIDMNSIVCTDISDAETNGKFVGHLKADDFFGTDKFPKANFTITKITQKKATNYEVVGTLKIKEISNEISFPAVVSITPKSLGAVAKMKIDRTKYGIKYGSGSFFDNLGDKAIKDEFELNVNIVASK